MKKIIFLAIFILASTASFSQNWQWARHLGGGMNGFNSEGVNNIITDGINYYAIGDYSLSLYLPADTLNSNRINDIFIAKFDASGNPLWAQTLGGNYNMPDDHETAWGTYDSVGNCIYIGGVFINSINFGGSISLSSPQSYGSTIFLAKMDLNGNFIWAKKGGGPGIDRARVYLSPMEKIYLVTQSDDSSFFDNYSLGPGGAIVQYDTSGACLSAEIKFTHETFATINNVYLNFINTDLIIYGLYRSDTFQLDTASLINQGVSDAFLARADSNGNVKWIKSFGYSGADAFQSLSIDNSGYLYVTGAFQDSINLGGSTLLNNNGNDILIAKFNSNGNNIWSKQAFANGSTQTGFKIIADGDGNCYITGMFSGSASFGTYNVSTTNQYDMFLTRYDNNGGCLGFRQFGTAAGTCLAVDNSGNVVCGGPFINTVAIGSNTFTAYQAYDIYVAKIDEFTGIDTIGRFANNQLIIYANPNAGKCNITVPYDFLHEKNLILNIYDNMGKLIQQKTLQMNDGKIKLNLEAEAKGVYNVSLSNGKKSYNGKIVFE